MIVEPLTLILEAAFAGSMSHPSSRPARGVDDAAVAVGAAESWLAQALPEPLKDYHATVGSVDEMMNAHSRFLPPEELSVRDGFVVFCHEAQHVMEWAVRLADLGQPNPPVHGRLVTGPDAETWHVESASLSAFLLGFGTWQAVLSCDESGECELPVQDLPALDRWFVRVGTPEQSRGGSLLGFVDRPHRTVAVYDIKDSKLYVGTPVEGGLQDFETRSGIDLSWY